MRLIRRISAAILLAALLVGAPIALFTYGTAGALVNVDWWRVWTTADDGRLFLGALSLLAWLAWAVLATAIVIEVLNVLSQGRVRLRLPGTGWLRPAVAGLVIAAAGLPLAATAAPVSSPVPLRDATAALPSLDVSGEPAASDTTAQDELDHEPALPQATLRHLVQPNDDLWSLAERYLGSGSRWRDIARANPHLDTNLALTAGHRLVIPLDDSASPRDTVDGEARAGAQPNDTVTSGDRQRPKRVSPPPPGPSPAARAGDREVRTVVVRRGDSLWRLAEEHLGDPLRWPEIYHLNRDQIADPDEIDIGWTLHLPPVARADAGSSQRDAPGRGTAATSAAPTTPPTSHDPTVATPSERSTTGPAAQPVAGPAAPSTPRADGNTPTSSPTRRADPSATQTRVPSQQQIPAGRGEQPPGSDQRHGEEPPMPGQPTQSQTMDGSSMVAGIVGSIGAGLAAALLTQLGWRRWGQRARRGLGRRVPSASPTAARFEAALARRASDPLDSTGDAQAPLSATAVLLGWHPTHEPITVDLEADRLLRIEAGSHHADDCTAALVTSLLCSDWSQDVELVVVAGHAEWAATLNAGGCSAVDDTAGGLRQLQQVAAARRVAIGSSTLDTVRADPDRAAAFTPVVFIFCAPLTVPELTQAAEALDLGACGVAAVCAVQRATALPQLAGRVLTLSAPASALQCPDARLTGVEGPFTPQLVSAPARHALIDLFHTADSAETSPAPWWRDDDTWPDNVTPFPHRSNRSSEEPALDAWSLDDITTPTLLLLGPVELRGARGPEPTRSRHQCEEYCAWLLENPGGTPTDMADALIVAESTRRSNMSRLRTWLGTDDDGSAYLPEAYTGRLQLHADVTSDWEQFNIILAGGVNRASPLALEKALALVRGEPLSGSAEWQWAWATELSSDMVSMICDAAVTLAHTALATNDIRLARWAVECGTLASPHDERLMVTSMRLEHAAGNHDRVQKLVRDLTRRARASGEDLNDETIRAIQHVMSLGGRRAHID